jgi:sulfite exporter TauE/SafE
MFTILSLTLLGFFLGMRHATDPDHVIAVGTIVTRQPTIRAALVIGGLWGIGHTLTIVAVGIALLVFSVEISPRVGLSMEMGVAMMLIVLGIWNLTGIFDHIRRMRPVAAGSPEHVHSHGLGSFVHSHKPGLASAEHGHENDQAPALIWLDRRLGGLSGYQILRPLIIGLVHGLAGSAAVALLVLALIKNPWWSIAYLLVFGIGTIAGMMLITAAIGGALVYATRRRYRLERLRVTAGFISVGFGLFLAYQIAVVDSLFTGNPTASMLH